MPVSVEKVSVALGKEELEWAKRRAERDGSSVSAVLTEVARAAREQEAERAQRKAAWDEFLVWATDGKGISQEDLEEARRELEQC